MDSSLFQELSIVIVIVVGISLLMLLLRQPLIIGYILTGLVVGPTILNIATDSNSFVVFSDIGIALLLFLVGLSLNPKVIKEIGRVAIMTGIGQVLFTTAFGFLLVSLIIDMPATPTLYVALALSFSSTIIILKLLNDKKELTRLHGKIAIGFLLVQDVLATFALIYVSANSVGGMNSSDLATLIINGILLVVILYIISSKILPLLNKTIAGSQELLFLFSIGWGLGIAAIFKWVGFSLEVGALAAGVSLAQYSYAQEVTSRLKPLRDFFIVLFFIVLGSHLDLTNIMSVLPEAILLSVFVLIGNPIIVMAIMGALGYAKKTSFKTSLAVAQISEFSLVLILLANKTGQISDEILSMMTVVGLITIAVSSYIILYDEKLYLILERYLGVFVRRKTKSDRQKTHHSELILFGFKKGGSEFIKVFKKLGKRFTVIDYNPDVIDSLKLANIPYLFGDVTDIELLNEVGIDRARLVISVVSDIEANKLLLNFVTQHNPSCIVICQADDVTEATQLYGLRASYVMMPHYIGSEKMNTFIKKFGLNKAEFRKFREKHITYLQTHYIESESENF